jgi:hypothetical protein
LRKVHADTLTEEATLDTGATCNQIAYSQAGLVVVLNSAQVLWVVDPDSLKVVHEIPVPGVRLVAGCPATPFGYAVGAAADETRLVGFGDNFELSLIDFAQGVVLQRSKSEVVRRAKAPDGSRVFDGAISAHMSPDGKYLYLGHDKIQRFRIDGHRLAYEEATGRLANGHTTHFALSSDGKWTAMPTGGGNGQGYGIAVFDALHLAEQKLVLDIGAYPCAIGFDTKTGNIYAPNYGEMNVFSPRGGKLYTLRLRERDVRRIIVAPQGERFLAWSEKKITCYRALKDKPPD